MGKVSDARRVSNNEAVAKIRMLRISPRKLGLVVGLIRNMNAEEALVQLTFMKKRIAHDVKKCLQSAIANAENNHNLNIDNLFVKEAIASKSVVMKRMQPCARGKAGKIKKFFSHLSITVCEYEEI